MTKKTVFKCTRVLVSFVCIPVLNFLTTTTVYCTVLLGCSRAQVQVQHKHTRDIELKAQRLDV